MCPPYASCSAASQEGLQVTPPPRTHDRRRESFQVRAMFAALNAYLAQLPAAAVVVGGIVAAAAASVASSVQALGSSGSDRV
jgi:hypothetical protein